MSRIIGLDYGTKRIGVAVSDETQTIAVAKPYLLNKNQQELLNLITDYKPELIILGRPISLSGEESKMSERVKSFADWLEVESGVPVHFLDERFSSEGAESEARERGLSSKKLREEIDSLVAQRLLQDYLNSKKT